MRMRRISSFFLLLLSALPAFANSQKVRAVLRVPYASVLPGIPFDVSVQLTNVSTERISVGSLATISVRRSDGETFSPEPGTFLQPTSSPSYTWVELESGATAELSTSWLYGDGIGWTGAYEFSAPGTYDVVLTLRTGGEEPANYVGTIRTTAARVTRIAPEGIDSDLWSRMSKIAGGKWSDDGFTRYKEGKSLADEIIDTYPSSGYYPYALLMRTQYDKPDELGRTIDAAKRFAKSPAVPYLWLHVANQALSEADKKIRQNERPAEYFAIAADALERLASSRHPGMTPNVDAVTRALFHLRERAARPPQR